MVPEIDLNLASKASSNGFASILKNLKKYCKGQLKSRFGEEENNKKTQKINRKSMENEGRK